MSHKILLLGLSLTQYAGAFEEGNNYFYNASNKKIVFRIDRGSEKEYSIRSKQRFKVPYLWKPTHIFWSDGHPVYKTLELESFQEKFPEKFVIIFEADEGNVGTTVRAVSKKQFDEEYAKAMKETQKKYTPAIQEGTPLPPQLCGIVSEYYVEKPEK